jgi:hypothetical protein
MEVEGTVKVHSADDDKEKYVVTIVGMTAELVEVKVKLQSEDDALLNKYPRGERFAITIGAPKEKQTRLKQP